MAEAHETILEVNLNALEQNYIYLKSKLQKKTKFLAVVKAFGYGSDAGIISQKLQQLEVDYFAVAYTSEGVALRKAGITKPILVFHPQIVNFKTIIKHCLEPSLYSFKVLEAFQQIAKEFNQANYPVHIKFNTGLNRLGFNKNKIDSVISILKASSVIKVKSVFSHLAVSEDLKEFNFTNNQIASFKRIADTFTKNIGYKPIIHLCNTSGVLNYPKAHFDMVRCGIGLYGFGNSKEKHHQLTPIASLKSIISQIHDITEGDSVGYNRAYVAKKNMKIATIPVGHADGLGRQYGNEVGFVYINQKKAFIVGNVCMDMIMVDVTNIPCEEGNQVVIFNEDQSAENLALSSGTISYELISSISQRIPRSYIDN
ncbi:MAG: alanine racemase [Bacteroidetes bacterium]|nr:alanine racemase [Bacteroidota bacterium]